MLPTSTRASLCYSDIRLLLHRDSQSVPRFRGKRASRQCPLVRNFCVCPLKSYLQGRNSPAFCAPENSLPSLQRWLFGDGAKVSPTNPRKRRVLRNEWGRVSEIQLEQRSYFARMNVVSKLDERSRLLNSFFMSFVHTITSLPWYEWRWRCGYYSDQIFTNH